MELAKEYISCLQSAPKYDGQPDRVSESQHTSAAKVRNHVRVLRGSATWLQREAFTDDNVLAQLKVPQAAAKMLQTLSDEEIGKLFGALDQDKSAGCRNAAILLLFLDTGLRCSDLLNLPPKTFI